MNDSNAVGKKLNHVDEFFENLSREDFEKGMLDARAIEKPVSYEGRRILDLVRVLIYINQFVPGFKKGIWRFLCNTGYISNSVIPVYAGRKFCIGSKRFMKGIR